MTGGILLERLPRGLNERPLMPAPAIPATAMQETLTPTHLLLLCIPACRSTPDHSSLQIHAAVSAPGSVLGNEHHILSHAAGPPEWPICWDSGTKPNTKRLISLVCHVILTQPKGKKPVFRPQLCALHVSIKMVTFRACVEHI